MESGCSRGQQADEVGDEEEESRSSASTLRFSSPTPSPHLRAAVSRTHESSLHLIQTSCARSIGIRRVARLSRPHRVLHRPTRLSPPPPRHTRPRRARTPAYAGQNRMNNPYEEEQEGARPSSHPPLARGALADPPASLPRHKSSLRASSAPWASSTRACNCSTTRSPCVERFLPSSLPSRRLGPLVVLPVPHLSNTR